MKIGAKSHPFKGFKTIGGFSLLSRQPEATLVVRLNQSDFVLANSSVIDRIGPVTDSANCFSFSELGSGPDRSLGKFQVAMVTPTCQWKEPHSLGQASDWLEKPGLN